MASTGEAPEWSMTYTPSVPVYVNAAVATQRRPSLSKASAATWERPRASIVALRPAGPRSPFPRLMSAGAGVGVGVGVPVVPLVPPHAATSTIERTAAAWSDRR